MSRAQDPTEPIRRQAGRYAGVDEGTACTQSSFKIGGKAFLFIGEQGGRYKAMFKLSASLPEAEALAQSDPYDYQVGSWVTARFTSESPLPTKRWKKWLQESYELSAAGLASRSKSKKSSKKKTAKTSAKRTKKKSAKKATKRASSRKS